MGMIFNIIGIVTMSGQLKQLSLHVNSHPMNQKKKRQGQRMKEENKGVKYSVRMYVQNRH